MTDNNHEAVADYLSGLFRKGIQISEESIAFADSALNARSNDELRSLLQDADEYGGGLIDLVFSPDERTRIGIERLIRPEGIPLDRHGDIVARLSARNDAVTIYLPGSGEHVVIYPSERLMRRFIGALHLEKDLGYMRVADTESPSNRDVCIRARVLLRSRSFTSTRRRELYLGRLLAVLLGKKEVNKSCLLDCLDFIVRLFRDIADDIDVDALVSQKIIRNNGIIERKMTFSEYSRSHSMEYLMSQRIFDPPESMDFLMKEALLADIVTCVVSERESNGIVPVGALYNGGTSCEGLEGMIRRLESFKA